MYMNNQIRKCVSFTPVKYTLYPILLSLVTEIKDKSSEYYHQ